MDIKVVVVFIMDDKIPAQQVLYIITSITIQKALITNKMENRKCKRTRNSAIMSVVLAACNGSVYTCTHTEEYYLRTDGQTVYLGDQMTIKLSLANPLIRMMPLGTLFTDLLYGILPIHISTLCYGYGYVYVYSLSRSPRAQHHCVKSPYIVASGTRT